MNKIRCGNHGTDTTYHTSVAEVRACYASGQGAETAISNPRAATPKQIGFIKILLSQRVVSAQQIAEVQAALPTMGITEATALIGNLKEYPIRPRLNDFTADGMIPDALTPPARQGITENGIYRNPATGEIFKVQWNRASGDGRRLYAKKLLIDGSASINLDGDPREFRGSRHSWQFAKGAVRIIRPEWRLTRIEAEKFGRLYGVCFRCHRDLTDETSIARAMGPVCAGREGW